MPEMPENLAKDNTEPNPPDDGFELFETGLRELYSYKYSDAVELFAQSLAKYEKSSGQKNDRISLIIHFLREWAKGLAFYESADLKRAVEAFQSAKEFGAKLPDNFQEELLPPVDFFLRIVPLDEKLKSLLTNPKNFKYLTDELDKVMEPLSDLLIEASLAGTTPEIASLIVAKTNICSVLLYVLGRFSRTALLALIRHDNIEHFQDAPPERIINWILTQEQSALLSIGFERAGEVTPAINHFVTELIRLGAPEKLAEIPEEAKSRLLTLLTPLNVIDGFLSKEHIISPVMKEAVEAFRELFSEYEGRFSNLLTPTSGETKTIKPLASFPTPKDSDWDDLKMSPIDEHTIQAFVKGRQKKLSYIELGFQDSRTGQPDIPWQDFKALLRNNGEISWDSPDANKRIKRSIYLISKRLKAVFHIPGHPFYPYKEFKAYKARFRVEEV